jgi:DNA-cytosine methyltransferase
MMNVLSLFDGISCARVAIERSGIKIDKYFSSEVEKSCIESSKLRFPDNIFLGDVREINKKKLPKIDLLIGGSPCQDLSNAFKGKGLEGARSSLFYDYVRLLNSLKPKFFLLENVQNQYKYMMDEEMGVEGVNINSALFSAQSRPRCYWTNMEIPKMPDGNLSVINDILEDDVDEYYFLDKKIVRDTMKRLSKDVDLPHSGIRKLGEIDRDFLKDNERQRRVYSIMGKSPTLLARSDSPKILIGDRIRKLTPLECERLQCVPDHFTEGFSKTSRYKMIGNGFTVSVISHILGSKKLKAPPLQLKLNL